MHKKLLFIVLMAMIMPMTAQNGFESDAFKTAAGELRIYFIGHGSLHFHWHDLTIYVDPDGRLADFAKLPKAGLILVTHQHGDHFDPPAIEALRRDSTQVFVSASCLPLPAGARILKNGDRIETSGVVVDTVPAYNIVQKRPDGRPFHPRGEGNGYVLTFPGLRVYVAGDTENIPEMKELRDIAVAFLPMNLPYTMPPEMAALAARAFRPRVLYPYHFSDTDPQRLVTLLRGEPGIEVRVRKMN